MDKPLFFSGGPQEVFLTTSTFSYFGLQLHPPLPEFSITTGWEVEVEGGGVEGRRGEELTEEVVKLEEQETLWTE